MNIHYNDTTVVRMGIPVLVRRHVYIETPPDYCSSVHRNRMYTSGYAYTWEMMNMNSKGCWSIGFSKKKKTLQLRSGEIAFTKNAFLSCPIILKFCSEHGSDTVVLWAKCQNDWTMEMDIVDERVFVKFQFNVCWGEIFCIASTSGNSL